MPIRPSTHRSYAYLTAGICFSIQALGVGTYIAFGVFFNPLMETFGWSRAVIAGASSLAFFMMGLFAILAGRLNDRFGPRPIMTVTALLLGLGCVLMVRLSAPWELYLFYGLIFGIGGSSVDVIALTTVARWFSHRRGFMTGVVKVGTGAGQFAIPLAAGWLILHYGWRWSFVVIGAGVAGLAAIGAARGLGAIVRAFDTRPAVKEQVESMDAEFLMLDFEDEDGSGEGGYAKVMSDEFIKAEMELFAEQARDVDIIITTALIPGRPAPKLITAEMVESMKDGSVIVDLAAEQGGNCELTKPNECYAHNGVTIIGYTDMASRLAAQSSQLYGTNLRHLLTDMTPEKDGNIVVDFEDEVVRGATICKEGETTWPPPARRPA